MKRMRTALPLLLALLPTAALAQSDDDEWLRNCRDNDDEDRVPFCEVRVERFPATGGTLAVDAAPNGGVKVVAWDRNEIEVHARIGTRARSEAEARQLAEAIDLEMNASRVHASGPESRRNASWYVSWVVMVPARSDLEAGSVNGPVSISGVAGRVRAQTVNGPMLLEDMAGDVEAHTQNGPLRVTLAGSRWEGAGLNAYTVNGPVDLRLPEGYSAQLTTGTLNGPMTTDIPLTVTLRGSTVRQIETTLGQGGPPVRVVTTNGPLQIRRR